MDTGTDKWTRRDEYPFAGGRIFRGTIVYAEHSFYHIAGKSDSKHEVAVIGRLDESNWRWYNAGELMNARFGHNAIYVPSEGILVIGGSTQNGPFLLKNEVCTILDGTLACREQSPTLENYLFYPELFVVPDNFCQNGL